MNGEIEAPILIIIDKSYLIERVLKKSQSRCNFCRFIPTKGFPSYVQNGT
jgi:hypothetical protein